jgi:acetyl-CoA acetyltransferase
MLDSVMVCDGANGVLVTSTENAARLGLKKAVYPTGYGEITNFNGDKALSDITETGFSVAGPSALKQAGLTPKDIQLFAPYDDFLIAILIQLEQIGFCGRGEGSDFILKTDMTHTGKLPLNTSGGQSPPVKPVSPAVASTSWKRCVSCSAKPARGRLQSWRTPWLPASA